MDEINSNDKYIFLDIDGVLQPFRPCHRFEVNRKELIDKICEEFHDDFYQQLDEYDVAAVYLDWNEEAVKNLKKLIDETNAKIILSTAWRESRTMKEMEKLFKLHELDHYIAGMTLSELNSYSEWQFSSAKNEEDLKRMKEIHSNSFTANHLNKQKNM